MPTLEDIQRFFIGTWRMMTGRADGISLLDISEDGFWNSFYAMIVAAPALLIGWVSLSNDLAGEIGGLGDVGMSRFGIVARAAIVDGLSWVLPLVILAVVARKVGIAQRFPHYVVASNWGSALIAWLLLPASLLRLLLPASVDINALVGLASFGIVMALSYRLTQSALQKPHTVVAPLFAAIVFVSVLITIMLQSFFGIAYSVGVSG